MASPNIRSFVDEQVALLADGKSGVVEFFKGAEPNLQDNYTTKYSHVINITNNKLHQVYLDTIQKLDTILKQ